MNSILVTGVVIFVFAFASYSTAIVTQLRRRSPTPLVRAFLHRYTIAAFAWWTLAFIAGPIVAFRM
jgi:hypothetical protein